MRHISGIDKGIDVITHLPSTPKLDPRIGHWALPVVVDSLKTIETHQESVTTFNNIGRRSKDETTINDNLQTMSNLGIDSRYYIDNEPTHLSFINDFLAKGLKENWIRVDEKEVYISDDKRIQFLKTDENLHSSMNERGDNLYTVKNGRVYDLNSGSEITPRKLKVLLLTLPEIDPKNINILPEYGKSEFTELVKNYSNREILISRVDEKPIKFSISGLEYFIDIDVCWANFMNIFKEIYDINPKTLVVVNRSIKKAVLSFMVTQLYSQQTPENLLVIPRSSIVSDEDQEQKNISKYFFESFGYQSARVLLTLGLGSHNKDLQIPSTMIYWLKRSLEEGNETRILEWSKLMPSITEIYRNNPNTSDLGNALKLLRKGNYEKVTDYYKWLLARYNKQDDK